MSACRGLFAPVLSRVARVQVSVDVSCCPADTVGGKVERSDVVSNNDALD